MNTSKIKMETELSDGMKDALSGTFLYGIHWDGHCLARGQLTNRALWQMRKMSRKYKEKRTKKLSEAKSPATGGFELMMQVAGNPGVIQQYTPRVLKAWSDYFTYTRHFSFIKSPVFQSGIHLILIGWYLDDGSMRIRSTVVPHPKMLTDDDLMEVAKEFMATEAKEHPTTLPKAFKSTGA
ncbi:MAG: hypothetical protein AB2669_17590 [Candidatus Thiodiazotropha endolucinida]|nr:hypothetical protein [Candidatus Thiodiazotropha taylori]MCW4250835.1 hypothetical protein [Candidatus Thiodiazotropha endolucinida]MCG8040098.1 hypothetical protein [Candidatus Thiodiazotropha taylori]MCG8104553.1 hypothetical protein [Candidatus Thiodiazotropha taylori]MCG8121829.1 hypothetical protein [Candidatus Thiodiazotropha taylori]